MARSSRSLPMTLPLPSQSRTRRSPKVLNSQNPPPAPNLPTANLSYPLLGTFDSSSYTTTTASTFPPIQPFQYYNYFDGPGEDLCSPAYTGNAENMWEVNWALTHALRPAAQPWSSPQLTTYVPADHWNPHQWMQSANNQAHPPQPPQPPPFQMDQVTSGATRPPHNELPESNIPRRSPRASISPLIAGPSNHHNSLATSATSAPASSVSRGRRRRGSIRSDTSEGNFRCKDCGKSYFRKAELDRHRRTAKMHNGIGKYVCGGCGRCFTRDDARLRHARLCEMGGESLRSSSGRGKGTEQDTDMDVDVDDDESSWGPGWFPTSSF
ncbi:hypothetical protein BDV93DRAFT_509775 [Ceratobasidium sp. AG-I]|nr:hypothetical protein BDV93DRAFT_509775 [Ceratobasidium sp. AG-I]